MTVAIRYLYKQCSLLQNNTITLQKRINDQSKSEPVESCLGIFYRGIQKGFLNGFVGTFGFAHVAVTSRFDINQNTSSSKYFLIRQAYYATYETDAWLGFAVQLLGCLSAVVIGAVYGLLCGVYDVLNCNKLVRKSIQWMCEVSPRMGKNAVTVGAAQAATVAAAGGGPGPALAVGAAVAVGSVVGTVVGRALEEAPEVASTPEVSRVEASIADSEA